MLWFVSLPTERGKGFKIPNPDTEIGLGTKAVRNEKSRRRKGGPGKVIFSLEFVFPGIGRAGDLGARFRKSTRLLRFSVSPLGLAPLKNRG
ncbi:hypothetical protein JTE90_009214 [Oedothorax gibbosus]|uniref:Uncharacterized protein n=1 Tax=Oedothorax gibbosus TaxID=931172 RepID=A0AAV6THH5_9ARAC|nr:hypothetical protein JTE90_009214 [Oedothorax gibbosus]